LKEWIELERDGEAFNKMKNLKTLLIDDLGCSDGSPEHRSNSLAVLDYLKHLPNSLTVLDYRSHLTIRQVIELQTLGYFDGSPEHRSNSRRLLDGGGSHFTGGMVFPSKASVIVWFCLGRKIN
jgi:hypothetical protein